MCSLRTKVRDLCVSTSSNRANLWNSRAPLTCCLDCVFTEKLKLHLQNYFYWSASTIKTVDYDSLRFQRRIDEWCASIESRLDCLVWGKSEVKAGVRGCPSSVGECDARVDMRRRWSNNGGFQTLRMLEESSSEVTSSSALGLPPAMVMSPESLASPEYGLDLWNYDDGINYNTAQSLLGNTCTLQQQPAPTQTLPSMPLPMPPTTPKSENESISSGQINFRFT